jgi:hypothetical protein
MSLAAANTLAASFLHQFCEMALFCKRAGPRLGSSVMAFS